MLKLKDLKFKYKILIFPALFATMLVLTFLLTLYFNRKNEMLLNQTENVYLPSIEISSNMATKLTEIQRSLQDAVSSVDLAKVEKADTLAKNMGKLCKELIAKSAGKNAIADSIVTLYNAYYTLAREVTVGMIGNSIST